MKSLLLLSLILCVPSPARAQAAAPPAAAEPGLQRVTLYGPIARGHDATRALYSFKTGAYGRRWDLGYGSLYVSQEHDWFQVSTAEGVRTAMRDLGARKWTDSFEVPVVTPFPKLGVGERRTIVVDTSGADGKDGARGVPGPYAASEPFPPVPGGTARAQPDGDGVVREPQQLWLTPERVEPARRQKHDGVPRVDPVYTRAKVGHMYVLRVVDGAEDFYVLFRVESLVRGDSCTITWKRVPAPQAAAAGQK
jgi:hypothetical protein